MFYQIIPLILICKCYKLSVGGQNGSCEKLSVDEQNIKPLYNQH